MIVEKQITIHLFNIFFLLIVKIFTDKSQFLTLSMFCNNVLVDMKPPMCITWDVSFHMEEELFVSNKIDHIAKVLDVKYKPVDFKTITENLLHLNHKQKEQLDALLDNQCSLLTVG